MKKLTLLLATMLLMVSGCNKPDPGVKVESVTISPSPVSIKVGESVTLTATVKPDNATERTLIWESHDPAVAKVDKGVVKGISEGSTIIQATAGDKVGLCAVTVTAAAVPVESISLDCTRKDLPEGESFTLTATVLPADATDKIVWTTNDAAIATVADGTVTAVARGTAIITASAGGKTAACQVNVKAAFSSVDLGLSIQWGNMNLGAQAPEEDGWYYVWGELEHDKSSFDWSTYRFGSDTKFQKYVPFGYYHAEADGKALLDEEDDAAHAELGGDWRIPTSQEIYELFATKDNEKYRWENVEINGKPGRKVTYLVNGNSIVFPLSGWKFRTTTAGYGMRGRCLAADCNATTPSYVYVLNTFLDTKAGEETEGVVTMERYCGCPVRPVKGPRTIPVSKLTVNMNVSSYSLAIGESVTLNIDIWPENATDKSLKWTSDNPEVATVDASGFVRGVSTGEAVIYCRAGFQWISYKVYVSPLGYGFYVKNELDWENTYLKFSTPSMPLMEPTCEVDGYMFFPLDESLRSQEKYFTFSDNKGQRTNQYRVPNYTPKSQWFTITESDLATY